MRLTYRGGVWDLVRLLVLPERDVHDVGLEERDLSPVAEKVYLHDLLYVNAKSVFGRWEEVWQSFFVGRLCRARIILAGLIFRRGEDHAAKLSWNGRNVHGMVVGQSSPCVPGWCQCRAT